MDTAFHIVVVTLFSFATISYAIEKEGEGVSAFITWVTMLFITVWAWLHMFRVW